MRPASKKKARAQDRLVNTLNLSPLEKRTPVDAISAFLAAVLATATAASCRRRILILLTIVNLLMKLRLICLHVNYIPAIGCGSHNILDSRESAITGLGRDAALSH